MDNFLTSLDIRNPGLRTLPPGVERYFVQGGGLSIMEISAEDKIEIINDEGKQICEVIAFNSKGKCDLSILNLNISSGPKTLVELELEQTRSVVTRLKKDL